MRIFAVIIISSLLGLGAATGTVKGGAERGEYYMIYMEEEVFLDKKDWTIAPDCVGTRTGIRGQQNRCNLKELCEYIWHDRQDANKVPMGDVKPDSTKTLWDPKAFDDGGLTGNKVIAYIDKVKYQPGVTDTFPAIGYKGGVDPGKVMPGESDWYQMNEKMGNAHARAKAEIDRQAAIKYDPADPSKGGFAGKEGLKLSKLPAKVEDISNYALDVRRSDACQMAMDSLRGYRHYNGNRPLEWSPMQADSKTGFGKSVVKEPNRDKTIAAWVQKAQPDSEGHVNALYAEVDTPEKAATVYDNSVAQAKEGDNGLHQMAIDAQTRCRNTIRTANAAPATGSGSGSGCD